jgi:mono/diheme cytochrome c family protein
MSRFNVEIILGTILIALTSFVLIFYGLNEEDRMSQASLEHQAQAIEVGASLFESNCTGCHGTKGEGIPGLCPPLNDKNFFEGRMKEVGWAGSLEDYIISTVASGRTVSTRPDQYAGQGRPAMPAWSDEFGGPLRADQIQDLAQYILNWESTASGEVVIEPLPTPTLSPEDITDPVARGQLVFLNRGCTGCHTIEGLSTATIGPNLTTIGTVAATRNPGQSAEEYIRESILNPSAHLVEGFQDNIMPKNFGELIPAPELDDLVAYLLAQQ